MSGWCRGAVLFFLVTDWLLIARHCTMQEWTLAAFRGYAVVVDDLWITSRCNGCWWRLATSGAVLLPRSLLRSWSINEHTRIHLPLPLLVSPHICLCCAATLEQRPLQIWSALKNQICTPKNVRGGGIPCTVALSGGQSYGNWNIKYWNIYSQRRWFNLVPSIVTP